MKQTIKQTVCTAVISALALTGVLGNAAASQAAAGARKIVLNKKKVTVTVGKTFRLRVKKVTPAKAGKAVIYKSNNKNTASVSRKGVIKGIKAGTAKITVTSKKNKKIKATVKVTVKRAAASPGSTPPVNKVSETNVPVTARPSVPTATQSAYASQAPAATGTPTPTGTPAATNTPGNTASPSSTPPSDYVPATPPPVTTPPAFASFQYDFTDEASWKNESPDQTSTRINTDGSITIKFTKQYGAVNFALPDKAQSDSIEYKTYEFQYAVKGGEVGYVLYGSGAADGTGEHPVCTWPLEEIDQWLLTRYGFAKYEHINGGFQGIRFFCQSEASQEKPVYVIIKGLDFCNRDDLMFTGDPVEREIDFEDVDTGSVEKPME